MKTRNKLAAWAIGLALMIGLGILAGRRYLAWQVDRAHDAKIDGLEKGESTGLRPGMAFPNELLTAPNGQTVSTSDLASGAHLLVVFVSTHCDACASSLSDWNYDYDDRPGDVRLVGIADSPVDEVAEYVTSTGMAFPIYADPLDTFGMKYDVDVVPTVVGIDSTGTIRFVVHGIREGYSLERAIEKLRDS